MKAAIRKRLALSLMLSLLCWRARATGTWAPLVNSPPSQRTDTMLLLSDGTIMVHICDNSTNCGAGWARLTADTNGSYVNGKWSILSPMHIQREFFVSDLLRDGRVFVAGGEYVSNPTNTAEIYDPKANSWSMASNTPISPALADAISVVLPDGNVLVAPAQITATPARTLIFNPTNGWSAGPDCLGGPNCQAEASWVKLPDESILTVDADGTSSGTRNSERYIPSLNDWVHDAIVPINLYTAYVAGAVAEIGPAVLLRNGKALFLGTTGHTALYTPSGDTSPGAWSAGPDIPNGLVAGDSPAAVMANGKVLCVLGVINAGNDQGASRPIYFYEYDPIANSFTPAPSPTSSLPGSSYDMGPTDVRLLDLPDGTVLVGLFGNNQIYVYQPDGLPLGLGKPVISSITANGDGSYHLMGTGLNGISQGAAYGDDAQMDSNYPLVRFTDSNGNVYYGRTYNWSSTSVMTGCKVVTTEFMPPALPPSSYSLVVVANGIASDPVPFPGNYSSGGNLPPSLFSPFLYVPSQYSTVRTAYNAAPDCSTIEIDTGTYHEASITFNLGKRIRLESQGGQVTITR